MANNIKIDNVSVNAKLSNKNNDKKVKKEFVLEGLDCANCANKIEQKLNELEGIQSASVNFLTKTLVLEIKESSKVEELIAKVTNIVTTIESHVKFIEKGISKTLKKEIL